MKTIYWNTKNIKDLNPLIDIISDQNPDLFFLSEIDSELLEGSTKLLGNYDFHYVENPGCERVSILKKSTFKAKLHLQNKYYTSLEIEDLKTFVVSIHLPSQMFQHMDSLKGFIRDFRADIDSEIGQSQDTRIMVIGDFNVNPYEKPLIDFDGFGATNSTMARTKINHLTKEITTYYNPTWQLYNRVKFPGTKHFRRPSGSSYDIIEFHYLDQVVISQMLNSDLDSYKIDVIEKTGATIFYNETKNKTEISDHLPLLYEFKIKKNEMERI